METPWSRPVSSASDAPPSNTPTTHATGCSERFRPSEECLSPLLARIFGVLIDPAAIITACADRKRDSRAPPSASRTHLTPVALPVLSRCTASTVVLGISVSRPVRAASRRIFSVPCFAPYAQPKLQLPQSTHPFTFLGTARHFIPREYAPSTKKSLFLFTAWSRDGESVQPWSFSCLCVSAVLMFIIFDTSAKEASRSSASQSIPKLRIHSRRTCGGSRNEALQLMVVPPPTQLPAMTEMLLSPFVSRPPSSKAFSKACISLHCAKLVSPKC
mmetsp:Transcript_4405/g.17325  ORF Transcript_4405/g.17325 Transcript_4405/m.17325 type:complete len:273 (-) Transcript_4405:695-1513(-)